MLDDDIIKLDNKTKHKLLEKEFKEFSDNYIGLFDLVINANDTEMLMNYISCLGQVKSGKLTFNQASEVFVNKLNDKHLYPNFTPEEEAKMRQAEKDEKVRLKSADKSKTVIKDTKLELQ